MTASLNQVYWPGSISISKKTQRRIADPQEEEEEGQSIARN